jgi:hypothetical protein
MTPARQDKHGRSTVANQEPDNQRHEGAGLIRVIEPNAIGLARTTTALPRGRRIDRGVIVTVR